MAETVGNRRNEGYPTGGMKVIQQEERRLSNRRNEGYPTGGMKFIQ
jgi:hypothetical protein